MTRIYPDYVYSDAPRQGCWWDDTCDVPNVSRLSKDVRSDVVVIGAGFTGLSAALQIVQAGKSVSVVDANAPGWGASGRNGGFCCMGGSKLSDAQMDARYGHDMRVEWRRAERDAVEHVAQFLKRTGTDADVHSHGETWLAHKPDMMDGVEDECAAFGDMLGQSPEVHTADDLRSNGLSAGFHGGVTNPFGFALNPRKYVAALVRACLSAGVSIYEAAPVSDMQSRNDAWHLDVAGKTITTDQVLIATNGYSSEHVPGWLAGRYMPTQSSVIVTRPLGRAERDAQGWTSRQMCYDSRNLLHYFRLMPDNRMLFGSRGGLLASASSEQRARARVLRDFTKMFPEWSDVEITHYWSGMVCLSRDFTPFAGEVPDAPGLWAAMCYHGNGVAMGSFAGHLVGQVMAGGEDARPTLMRSALSRFPLGRFRRALMAPVYAGFMLQDR